MADDFRSYTLEVNLNDMPDGWLLFAIGEGKPVIAPPPVMDEIKELRSKLDRETKRGHDLAEQVAALQSKEVCGAAHDDDLIADCPWCKLEAVERFLVGDLRPPLNDPKAVQLAHESAAAVIRRNSETPR